MLALLTAVALAQFSPPGAADEVHVEGQCTYPADLVERAGGTLLVTCGEAVLSADSVTFAARGFAPTIRFVGAWDGNELEVSHIARRGQDAAEVARGSCRVQLREERFSAIVCTAIAGPRSYLANFIVPLL